MEEGGNSTWNVFVSRMQSTSSTSSSVARPGNRLTNWLRRSNTILFVAKRENLALACVPRKSACSFLASMLVERARHFLYLDEHNSVGVRVFRIKGILVFIFLTVRGHQKKRE